METKILQELIDNFNKKLDAEFEFLSIKENKESRMLELGINPEISLDSLKFYVKNHEYFERFSKPLTGGKLADRYSRKCRIHNYYCSCFDWMEK